MSGYYRDNAVSLLNGDVMEVLKELPELSIQCCVTSPPYWGLRDYGVEGQLGLEKTPEEYVAKMVEVFREVKRVLKADGTLWLNLGDSYAGSGKGRNGDGHHSQGTHWKQSTNRGAVNGVIRSNQETPELKPKDLVGIPWRVAFALQADGWYLRSDIIWAKPNPMPESVTDRPTKSHEYLFLMSKSERYYYDADAIKESAGGWNGSEFHTGKTAEHQLGRASKNRTHKGVSEYERSDSEEHRTKAGLLKVSDVAYQSRNKRSVWTVATEPYREAHFATFPTKLIEPCILAGSREGDTVLDCFAGASTTLLVAKRLNRKATGVELNPAYCEMGATRLSGEPVRFL